MAPSVGLEPTGQTVYRRLQVYMYVKEAHDINEFGRFYCFSCLYVFMRDQSLISHLRHYFLSQNH